MARDGGFSLIEVLAALSVLAIAGLALVSALTHSARAAVFAETRTLAALSAETVLVEARIDHPGGVPSSQGRIELAGRAYDWRLDLMATADPDLQRIEITLSEAGAPGAVPVYTLTAFQRRPS